LQSRRATTSCEECHHSTEQVRKVALTLATKGMTKWQDLAHATTEEVVSWFPEPTTRIVLMKMPPLMMTQADLQYRQNITNRWVRANLHIEMGKAKNAYAIINDMTAQALSDAQAALTDKLAKQGLQGLGKTVRPMQAVNDIKDASGGLALDNALNKKDWESSQNPK